MSSSVVKMASSSSSPSSGNCNGEKSNGNYEETNQADRTALNLSLSNESFLQAAISLKDQVVEATWRRRCEEKNVDPTVYTGVLGTAFACLRCYQVTGNRLDLQLSADIVDACTVPAASIRFAPAIYTLSQSSMTSPASISRAS